MLRTLFAVLVLTVTLLAQVTPALASCRTYTYIMQGQMTVCTVCCSGSSCTTTCL